MTSDGFPRTLIGLLRQAAETARGRGLIFVDEDELRVPWDEVEEQALQVTASLQQRGGQPGDRLAIVCQGLRPLVTGFFGAALAGIHPTILPTPISRRRLQGFVEHNAGIIRVARPHFLLVDEPVADVGEPLLDEAGLTERTGILRHETLVRTDARAEPAETGPDDIAVIQFTSGSTTSPRGVVLSNRHVTANAQAIVEHLEVEPGDVGGGWLPLYHDMGLIGNLLGAAARSIDLVLTTPFNFLRRPKRWLETMERHRVSITAGPNVSYRHLLERGEPMGRDLGAWRTAIIGAEPIDPELLEAFRESFVPVGFADTGFLPAYGLAEVGLMVTGVPVGELYDVVELDREALERNELARPVTAGEDGAVRIVGCGYPVRGTSVRIVGDDGDPLPDREIGEITVASPSLMQGYYNDPQATAEALEGEWLYTGDLGYVDDGQLFVTGRKKEVVILQGRNYYPQDIERVVQGLEEVRPGSVVAFGTRDGRDEGLVIVAAPRSAARKEQIASGIRDAVARSLNLPVLDVVLVESGRIPRTTSGKLCRGRCRDLYEEGGLT